MANPVIHDLATASGSFTAETDLLTGGTSGRDALDCNVFECTLENTGAETAETISVKYQLLPGGKWSTFSQTFAMVAGQILSLIIRGLRCNALRVTGVSASGTTIETDLIGHQDLDCDTFQFIVDGVDQGAQNGVATTRAINTTAPLTGGGNFSADRTFAVSRALPTAVGVALPHMTYVAGTLAGDVGATDGYLDMVAKATAVAATVRGFPVVGAKKALGLIVNPTTDDMDTNPTVYTLRKNGVDTALTVSVPAGSTAIALDEAAGHAVTFADGDTWDVYVANAGGGAGKSCVATVGVAWS